MELLSHPRLEPKVLAPQGLCLQHVQSGCCIHPVTAQGRAGPSLLPGSWPTSEERGDSHGWVGSTENPLEVERKCDWMLNAMPTSVFQEGWMTSSGAGASSASLMPHWVSLQDRGQVSCTSLFLAPVRVPGTEQVLREHQTK